jgi:hypothetical protein
MLGYFVILSLLRRCSLLSSPMVGSSSDNRKRSNVHDGDSFSSSSNSSSGPAAKKRRRSPTTVKRHEIYYFPDGNIVLQMKNIQFRVHLSQLSRKSHTFQNIVESQALVTLAGNDGVKVFYSDDEPSDFEALLRCVYDGMQ